MRFRDLFALVMIALGAWLMMILPIANARKQFSASKDVNRVDAERNSAVLLNQREWVEFQVPHHSSSVRLLTNTSVKDPVLPAVHQSDPRAGWRYCIEYELLDSSRKLIDKSEYNFRSRIDPLTNLQTGELVYPMFFADSSIATQTRVMQIGLGKFQQQSPAVIRVRTRSADAEIQGVVVRVLSQVERTDARKRSTWSRLSKKRRDGICKYCVYDSDLLSFEERANLLRWHWVKSPTVGEFPSRDLYTIGDLNEQLVDKKLLPAGKYIDEGWNVSIPIPPGQGDLRIQFIDLNGEPFTAIKANLQWIGKELHQRKESLAITSDHTMRSITGGLVQVQADQACVVRTFWRPTEQANSPAIADWKNDVQPSADGEYEITPEPIKLRTYLVDDRWVEYSVSHVKQQATPFRIAARQIADGEFFGFDSSDSHATKQLCWEFVGADNDVVDSGRMNVEPANTQHDHLMLNMRPIGLSDPQVAYFSIPANVSKIRFRSNSDPCLIACAVRPSQLVRETRVPEDYSPFERALRPSRSWFALRPAAYNRLTQENRTFIVRTQATASEVDPQILAGDYDWVRYVPSGNWIGRELLVPVDKEPDREQLVKAIYCQIERGQPVICNRQPIASQSHRVQLLLAGDQTPGNVRVAINGSPVFEKRFVSARGRIDLPWDVIPNADQPFQLTVYTENPSQIFVNGIEVQQKSEFRFVKRTTQRLANAELAFDYQKTTAEAEMLTLRLFRGASTSDRCRLRVRINPNASFDRSTGPSPGWTILDRVYDLQAAADLRSVLIDSSEPVDVGFRCFIKLDTDIPIGQHRIHVDCLDSDEEVYALLYQTLPGQKPTRDVKSIRLGESGLVTRGKSKPFEASYSQPAIAQPAFEPRTSEPATNQATETQESVSRTAAVTRDSNSRPDTRRSLDDVLRDALQPPSEDSVIAGIPDEDELQGLENLFAKTLVADHLSDRLAERWRKLGWQATYLKNSNVVLIREMENEQRGRGIYAIRLKSTSDILLQAPHRFFDERTGRIARKLFVENDIRAVAWNSIHRSKVDISHNDRHYFNAFMNALKQHVAKVVQIHGFESGKRQAAIRDTDLIVSDGTRFPSRYAIQSTIRLKESFGRTKARLFPREVNELGGTRNSQAALLRGTSGVEFLHVEMDSDFRETIARSASKRQEFADAVLGSELIRAQ